MKQSGIIIIIIIKNYIFSNSDIPDLTLLFPFREETNKTVRELALKKGGKRKIQGKVIFEKLQV